MTSDLQKDSLPEGVLFFTNLCTVPCVVAGAYILGDGKNIGRSHLGKRYEKRQEKKDENVKQKGGKAKNQGKILGKMARDE